MKRELGSTAGLIALLALVFHAQSNPGSEGGAAGARGIESKSSKRGKSGGAASSATAEEPLEGPWIATQAFFSGASHRLYEPSDGAVPPKVITLLANLSDRNGSPNAEELKRLLGLPDEFDKHYRSWSIVATVADPRHTRLSLFLDRQLEAIQKSFGKAGWEFATQWLPWMDPANPSEDGIGERTQQRWRQHRQEELPGIVVFRRPLTEGALPTGPIELAFVLLVPETPTAGINGESFFAAMHLANVLSTEPNEIGLLGPTFSGSFFSFSNLVGSRDARSSERHRLHRVVYGGSISNQNYAAAFEEITGFGFHGGIANGRHYNDVFTCVLKQFDIAAQHAAYLVEDVTGFSRAFNSDAGDNQAQRTQRPEAQGQCPSPEMLRRIPRYVVPRDIEHMRNAYKDATADVGQGRGVQPSASVDFTLKDPTAGEDSFPMFSDQQMPLSQDAAMRLITQDLKRKGTRIVMIATTNVLDSIFLARLIRRDSPDTRVVISNPDILFVAAAAQDPLAGTLFLSTYPMFSKGDEWFLGDAAEHLMFPGPDFQGIFNATQILLKEIKAANSTELLGYGNFGTSAGEAGHPGLWLLTLTRTGFVPIDLFEIRDAQQWFSSAAGEPIRLPGAEWPPPFAWRLTAFFSSLAILAGCFYLVACNVFSLASGPDWLELKKDTVLLKPRLLALLGACLSLSAFEWVLGFPMWFAISTEGHPGTGLLVGLLTFIGFLAPIASLIWIVAKLRKDADLTWKGEHLPHSIAYGGIASVLFLAVAGAWGYACVFQKPQAALFFRLRAVDVLSGASPATPLALLSLVFLFFSVSYFLRYSRTGCKRANPSLATLTPDGKEERDNIDRFILAPVKLEPRDWLWRMCVTSVFVLASLATLWRFVGAFEIRAFNLVLGFATAVVLLCLATACYDLTFLWKHFCRLLNLPEHVRLRFQQNGSVPGTLEAYIVYVRDQIRGIALHITVGFVMLSIVLNSYSPRGPMGLARFLAVLLVGVGLVVFPALAGMERNRILSKISGTTPGELNRDFWIRLIALGGLPLLGVVAHLFPSISTFLSSWVAPSVEALH